MLYGDWPPASLVLLVLNLVLPGSFLLGVGIAAGPSTTWSSLGPPVPGFIDPAAPLQGPLLTAGISQLLAGFGLLWSQRGVVS